MANISLSKDGCVPISLEFFTWLFRVCLLLCESQLFTIINIWDYSHCFRYFFFPVWFRHYKLHQILPLGLNIHFVEVLKLRVNTINHKSWTSKRRMLLVVCIVSLGGKVMEETKIAEEQYPCFNSWNNQFKLNHTCVLALKYERYSMTLILGERTHQLTVMEKVQYST